MPKLLYLVTEDWYFTSHRLPLARAAREAGYDVVVVTRCRQHRDTLEAAGLEVIPFEMNRRGMNPVGLISEVISIWRIYRKMRPDIVHHIALRPVVVGGIAAQFAGIKYVVSAVAGMGFLFTGQNRARWLRRGLERLLQVVLRRGRVIVQNPDDARQMTELGIGQKSLRLIRGSGVDTVHFSPGNSSVDTPIVMLATRLLWDKGVGEFVEAARRLRRAGVDARFVLVGDSDPGNPAAVPVEQVRDWETSRAVEWWGYWEDMATVLRKARIVCLPSYREGLPKVLLEAAASGKAIVTTDVPGCREVVRHGKNGLLVPARDSGRLAEAIRSLLEDPELCDQMGRQGRVIVEQEFSLEHVVEQTLAIYEELYPA